MKTWSLYLLFVPLASSQVTGVTVPVAIDFFEGAAFMQNPEAKKANVAPDTPVITIHGLCEGLLEDKATDPNCNTVITQGEFEKVIDAIQPGMRPRARREFALQYANFLVMSKKAEEMGLDKGANYEEAMKLARVQVLSKELNRAIQRSASQVSDRDIQDYYNSNLVKFEKAELDRIYVPRTRQLDLPSDRGLRDIARQTQDSEAAMKGEAEKLHARAVLGESFDELQREAYKTAGLKPAGAPNLGKIRRISLPPGHAWIMDLQSGQISSVISDPNGYFIYKVKAKGTISLDEAREEIKGIIRSEHIEDQTRVIRESAATTLNEVYFYYQRLPGGGVRPSLDHDGSARDPQHSERD